MASIYERALGEEFERLHPKIQERFGLSSREGTAAVGTGVMDEVRRGPFYTLPFLYVGTLRNVMFPETGGDVPFTVENYAYVDRYGRETVTWVRTFEFGGADGQDGSDETTARRFDATMVYSEERDRIVDYLGTHQHLAVDIHPSVADNGGLELRTGAQRLYAGPVGFDFPMLFSGVAEVCEWYDDEAETFRIEVSVDNPYWGTLFGYEGSFQVEYRDVDGSGEDDVPEHVVPVHVEERE